MSRSEGTGSHLVRTLGFVRKELWTVLRQPRLIMTLVVGPFVILMIFGFGYSEQTDPFRTLLVIESEEATLVSDIEGLGEAFGSGIELVGSTADAEEGLDRLESQEIDLLIIAPSNALQTIERGDRALFTVVHGEVDPIIRRSIGLLSSLSIDEINRQVLAAFVSSAQEGSTAAEVPVTGLSAAAQGLVLALESGDDEAARREKEALEAELQSVQDESSDALLEGVARTLGLGAGGLLGEVLGDLEGTDPDNPEALERARAVEAQIIEIEAQLEQAQDLDPELLVRPFGVTVETVNELPDQPAVFYSPGVVMLLVQHLAVTFGALTLVRERELGFTEIFRASPLSISEFLTGKYIAFLVIVGVVTTALTGLMILFGVPIGGTAWMYVATVMLVLLASLGLGFVISSVSQTDSQAIQYAMLVLLVSIFFTGFIIPLDRLLPPVHVVSFLLPATYGIVALHDIVFRSAPPHPALMAGLVVYVLVISAFAWITARKDVVSTAR